MGPPLRSRNRKSECQCTRLKIRNQNPGIFAAMLWRMDTWVHPYILGSGDQNAGDIVRAYPCGNQNFGAKPIHDLNVEI